MEILCIQSELINWDQEDQAATKSHDLAHFFSGTVTEVALHGGKPQVTQAS